MQDFNLWLKECAKDTFEIIFRAPPKTAKTGIAIQWPVNPELTGESGIIEILIRSGKFKGKRFKHSKIGIVSRVDGLYLV